MVGAAGFDSIVQAACGIATIESPDGTTPGVLPCQLLDHGTGYLAAAAALDGLRRQSLAGGTVVRSLSLAATPAWFTGTPTPLASHRPSSTGPDRRGRPPAERFTVNLDSPVGPIVAVAPPGGLDGRPLTWPEPAAGYGATRRRGGRPGVDRAADG